MEGVHESWRILLPTALVIAVLALHSVPAATCDASSAHGVRLAGESKQEESRRSKCKRNQGSRAVPKGCPEGGERLPNDNNKRSPLDDTPPLTPLVA